MNTKVYYHPPQTEVLEMETAQVFAGSTEDYEFDDYGLI